MMEMTIRRLFLAIYLILAASATLAQNPPPLKLGGPVEYQTILGHVQALQDSSGELTLDQVRTRPPAPGWQPPPMPIIDFGYTTSVIWLRLPVENTTPDVSSWRLHVNENFFQNFAVYVVTEEGREIVAESLGPDSNFYERDIPYSEMVAGFDLEPGARAELFIRYWSGGSSEITFDLHTQESFSAIAASRTAKNFAFYGMMLLLVAAALASSVITRQFVFFAYGSYAMIGLLFVMHADGNTFQYLWPGAPLFNGYATILLGAGLIVFGANFARQFLQTEHYLPRLDKVLLTAILAALAMVAASAVLDHQMIKKYLILMATGSVILFVIAGLIAARTRFREVRFYVLAWIGAVVSSVMMLSRHWLGVDVEEQVVIDSMRVVFVLDAGLMGFAIIDRFNLIRRDQRKALEASLIEAQRSISLSRRLQHLEDQYELAVGLADAQQRHLADTVHDLRQPLHALRLNVQAMMAGEVSRAELEDTFSYLEQLVNQELAEHSAVRPKEIARPQLEGENTRIDEVMAAVCDMFQADASAKGLRLRRVGTSAMSGLPPLALMRILSNLVANAVKFTDKGGILIGVRHKGGSCRLEVHDTGPGLTEEEFAAVVKRAQRLERDALQDGQGLGLSIVADLAQQHDLEFGMCNRRRDGAGIYVALPPARLG